MKSSYIQVTSALYGAGLRINCPHSMDIHTSEGFSHKQLTYVLSIGNEPSSVNVCEKNNKQGLTTEICITNSSIMLKCFL